MYSTLNCFFQGQLAFSDLSFKSHGEEPAIVITNPIDVRFSTTPNSIDAVRESTHIRVLVFATSTIDKVTATIDESNDVVELRRVSEDQPLFVADWNPSKSNDGQVHSIRVDVLYAKDQKQSRAIQFGLGDKQTFLSTGNVTHDFSFMAR